jgi:CheY-like chemotaxis protein
VGSASRWPVCIRSFGKHTSPQRISKNEIIRPVIWDLRSTIRAGDLHEKTYMNAGPRHPSSGGGKNKRRRGRRSQRRPGHTAHARPEHQGIFTAPMDHSYRANMGGDSNGSKGPRRPGFSAAYPVADPEPLPAPTEDSASRVFAFVEDLFFLSKIQDTGRKMNVKVEFVKTEKELTEHMKNNGEEKPSLIIFDLNNANAKPLTLIPKLKTKLKKGTSIIGFLSHVQGDLKLKAHEAGCDMVLPRSAFSQNLPQLLRRHGASDDAE